MSGVDIAMTRSTASSPRSVSLTSLKWPRGGASICTERPRATGTVLPIGWIAVGTPAALLPPERHEEVWAIQQELDFPGTVYGVDRTTSMRELLRGQSEFYRAHEDDAVVG